MQIQIILTLFIIIECISFVWSFSLHGSYRKSIKRHVALMSAPVEIAYQLDPSKSWDVKFIFNGEEKTVSVKEDCSMLEASEKIFDVESSCRNGVCTTCAAQIVEGKQSTILAVHGLGAALVDAGYVCACQCYVTGPGVVIKLGMYDELYEVQYGQYEKSYVMKYADKPKEEKKNVFGF